MRPGIVIQHAREVSRAGGEVRSDITGFIGVIPRARWPRGCRAGDFIQLPLRGLEELTDNPIRGFFDPVTRRAVDAFFENGGQAAWLFGVCIESPKDLCTREGFEQVFQPLRDRLCGEEDVALLVMPALAYLPVHIGRGTIEVAAEPAMTVLLEHCRVMNNRFALFDAPRDLHEDALFHWVRSFRQRNASVADRGAIYYPWLMNGDEMLPPTGPVAGLFARVDEEHKPFGVRWPPANQTLKGVTHPAIPIAWSTSGRYTEEGINPILDQPARGVVVWGARTLSSDPRWTQINSRRIVSHIVEQLRRDAEWVVFEQQRPELWETIRRMVTARLDTYWSAGLLTGAQAGEQYLVQCDKELNPPEVRDAGQVHVRVQMRPVSTTENIVVDLRLGT